MQTKNINLERGPNNDNNNANTGSAHQQFPTLPEVRRGKICISLNSQHVLMHCCEQVFMPKIFHLLLSEFLFFYSLSRSYKKIFFQKQKLFIYHRKGDNEDYNDGVEGAPPLPPRSAIIFSSPINVAKQTGKKRLNH